MPDSPETLEALERIDSRIKDMTRAADNVAQAYESDNLFRRAVTVTLIILVLVSLAASGLSLWAVNKVRQDQKAERVERCVQQRDLRADIRRSDTAMLDEIRDALGNDPEVAAIVAAAKAAAAEEVPYLTCDGQPIGTPRPTD